MNLMESAFFLSIAIALLLLNAFFVAAEFSLVKMRQTRINAIKKLHGIRGKRLALMHQHLDAYLSACQLGITLASLGLGWVGEPAFAQLLRPVFTLFPIQSAELITLISFIVAFSVISFLHIVIGELMPKSLAIQQAERVAVWIAIPLHAFYWVMYPGIWLLNYCSNFFLSRLGFGRRPSGDHLYSTDEIKLILNASHLHGELTKEEAEILEHTIEFADLRVTEIMRPQEEMVQLTLQTPIEETLKLAATHRFSRYPVFDEVTQSMIGVVHVKDLFTALYQEQPLTQLTPFIRPILKVSQRLPALSLLKQFREGMPHIALVYKSKETLLGFVTLDNLLHVLIGRIKDEFHRTQDDWLQNPDGSLLVRGDCPIFSLERALDHDIDLSDQDPEPETVSAMIINQLGRLPKPNERVEFHGFKAIPLKIRGSRIITIKIVPKIRKKNSGE